MMGGEKCGEGEERLMIQSRPYHQVSNSPMAWTFVEASGTG